MQALILSGGRGKRLRPLTDNIPKTLLLIAGKPVLVHQIEFLKKNGIRDLILSVGYKAKIIKDYLGDGKKFGVKIIYSYEKKPLGTGGAVKEAEKHIKGEGIVVLNGDTFSKINLKKMAIFHKKIGQPITIAYVESEDISRSGKVLVDDRNIIVGFKEKTGIKERGKISAGVYFFQKDVLKNIQKGKKTSLEKKVFPSYVGRIAAFKFDGKIIDMGVLSDYKKLNKLMAL